MDFGLQQHYCISKKNKISKVLQKIKEVCKPGAIGLITLKQGKREREEKETGRWFAFYTKSEFEKILKDNRIEIIKFEMFKDWRENNPDWLIFWVRIS